MNLLDLPDCHLAIHQAKREEERRHNWTFDSGEYFPLIFCPCGEIWMVFQELGEGAGVRVCQSCGDWHTVLFR